MAITKEVLDELLKRYRRPDDFYGRPSDTEYFLIIHIWRLNPLFVLLPKVPYSQNSC
jgi:hypothetical protein